MKIQYLTIIFVIIILPVIIITSVYNRMQINTIKLKKEYDARMIDSTYDAIKAFEINTKNGNFSSNVDSNRRNIEASINTFITSMSSGLGMSGYGESYIKPYIPAILFTLYDGYYIYSPTDNGGKIEHLLKPQISYSQRYVYNNIDIVINYTLDNYITIYGKIGNEPVRESGYLNAYLLSQNVAEETEKLSESLFVIKQTTEQGTVDIGFDASRIEDTAYVKSFIKDYKYFYLSDPNEPNVYRRKIYYDEETGRCFYYFNSTKQFIPNVNYQEDTSYNEYIDESKRFSQWVQDNLGNLPISAARELDGQTIDIFKNDDAKFLNFAYNSPEETNSLFSTHKREVIKRSIENNLMAAINNYDRNSVALDTTYHFKMPVIKENEWDKILTNISLVTFIQGLPMGFKTYNNYLVVTGNENEKYVAEDMMYFMNVGSDTYHYIGCTELDISRPIVGYRSSDFDITKGLVSRNGDEESSIYYYKHPDQLPCYYCIVNRLSSKLQNETNPEARTTKGICNIFDENSVDYNWSQAQARRLIYQKALGRERYNLVH